MRIFNLDSPVMVFLTKVANLMILNLLTIICCIPIITAGPAVTALYYVTIKMARGDDPYIVKSYFKSFKENFKQGAIIGIGMLVLTVVIILDWEVVLLMMSGTAATVLKVVLGVVTIFFVMTGLYIFPVLSRFENTIKQTVKNAFLISIMSLPKTVVIVLIHLLPLGLLFLTIQALPFLFLLGMPAVAYLSSMMFVRVFKKFEPEEEDPGNGDELAPLSFIVEEQQEKQAALEAEQAAERAARETEDTENVSDAEAAGTAGEDPLEEAPGAFADGVEESPEQA